MRGAGKRVLVSVMVVVALGAATSQAWAAPRARFAYVANANPGTVSAFTLDATTGLPTPVPDGVVSAGPGTFSVAIDPSGQFVYAANQGSDNVSMYAIHPGSGKLTSLGPAIAAGHFPRSVTVSPTDPFVYVANEVTPGPTPGRYSR